VLLLELFNRSIRRPVELARRLGAEPFATIPYIRTEGERRWRRNVIFGTLAAIVIGIPLALLAVHSFWRPLDSIVFGLEEQPPETPAGTTGETPAAGN
jgi:hypothetical protein